MEDSKDMISRQTATQTALDFIVEYLGGAFDEDFQKKLMERMNTLPSAQPDHLREVAKKVDVISRRAAIDALDCINGTEEVLRSLPPAQPERQTGKWIDLWDRYRCSVCNMEHNYEENFCPNCGADMRGEA